MIVPRADHCCGLETAGGAGAGAQLGSFGCGGGAAGVGGAEGEQGLPPRLRGRPTECPHQTSPSRASAWGPRGQASRRGLLLAPCSVPPARAAHPASRFGFGVPMLQAVLAHLGGPPSGCLGLRGRPLRTCLLLLRFTAAARLPGVKAGGWMGIQTGPRPRGHPWPRGRVSSVQWGWHQQGGQ